MRTLDLEVHLQETRVWLGDARGRNDLKHRLDLLSPMLRECRALLDAVSVLSHDTSPLLQLPDELLKGVLGFCSSASLVTLDRTCKAFSAPTGRGGSLLHQALCDSAVRSFGPELAAMAYGQRLPGPEAPLACLEAASSIASEVCRMMGDSHLFGLSTEEVHDQLADIHLHPAWLLDETKIYFQQYEHICGEDAMLRADFNVGALFLVGLLIELSRADRTLCEPVAKGCFGLAFDLEISPYGWQGYQAGVVGLCALLRDALVQTELDRDLLSTLADAMQQLLCAGPTWESDGIAEGCVAGWMAPLNIEASLVRLVAACQRGETPADSLSWAEQRESGHRALAALASWVDEQGGHYPGRAGRWGQQSTRLDGAAAELLPGLMVFVQDACSDSSPKSVKISEDAVNIMYCLVRRFPRCVLMLNGLKERPDHIQRGNEIAIANNCVPFLIWATTQGRSLKAIDILGGLTSCVATLLSFDAATVLVRALDSTDPVAVCRALSALSSLSMAEEQREQLCRQMQLAGVGQRLRRLHGSFCNSRPPTACKCGDGGYPGRCGYGQCGTDCECLNGSCKRIVRRTYYPGRESEAARMCRRLRVLCEAY